MTDDQKKLIVIITKVHKTDRRQVHQHDPNTRMLASYKLHEHSKTNFSKYGRFLGKLGTKKTINFDSKRLTLKKIFEYQF